ncbi:MAG TPA: FAD-dependent oxidoreductase [Pseudolabrys sp.]|nr:FAD-dependent oxidoreductase [Pseudolabrys sp.]
MAAGGEPAFLTEPERQTPVGGEYEVVVLGGGPAGIAAAAAAAQQGRRTLLVERYGFLGGMGTAAGVTNFCGLHANVFGEIKQVVHGVADDLLGRIGRLGGLNEPHLVLGKTHAQAYDTAAYKIAADDLLTSRGVDILFHAFAVGVVKEHDGRIRALIVETKSGRMAMLGQVFIDCSGDGDLAAFAGARFEKGDMLYPTMMFRLNNIDPVKAGEAWKTVPALMQAAEARGETFPRKGAIVRPQKHTSEWRVNVTQVKSADGRAVDGTDARALSAGEIDGRRQARAFFDFLKREAPGFSDAYIVDIPPQLGIRETRRITGLATLTADDVTSCAGFPDTVGVNGWPLEIHVAGDVVWRWPDIPGSRGYNHLPYRMLVPVTGAGAAFDNLLVAGRCASMTHEGQSAARVSGACFVMGEAAGTAAHLSLAGNTGCADIAVPKLQQTLENGGVFLGRAEH